jgi:hypothetical protein
MVQGKSFWKDQPIARNSGSAADSDDWLPIQALYFASFWIAHLLADNCDSTRAKDRLPDWAKGLAVEKIPFLIGIHKGKRGNAADEEQQNQASAAHIEIPPVASCRKCHRSHLIRIQLLVRFLARLPGWRGDGWLFFGILGHFWRRGVLRLRGFAFLLYRWLVHNSWIRLDQGGFRGLHRSLKCKTYRVSQINQVTFAQGDRGADLTAVDEGAIGAVKILNRITTIGESN